jgi:hypothetical protein
MALAGVLGESAPVLVGGEDEGCRRFVAPAASVIGVS